MSRIAKNSIKIDKNILCSFQNGKFNAKGKLGEMVLSVDPLYTVDIQETEIFVNPKAEKDKLIKVNDTIKLSKSDLIYHGMYYLPKKFGFIKPYNRDPERKGFLYEPWHYSYAMKSIPMLNAYLELDAISLIKDSDLLGADLLDSKFINKYLSSHVLGIDAALL